LLLSFTALLGVLLLLLAALRSLLAALGCGLSSMLFVQFGLRLAALGVLAVLLSLLSQLLRKLRLLLDSASVRPLDLAGDRVV